jgi:TolA protein
VLFRSQEAARQEAARQEAARQEAARQEAARQEAARQEAARQEAARQEAARQEAARQEAARQEAARQTAARQEAARQQAAAAEAARQGAEQEARRQAAEAEARRKAAAEAEAALSGAAKSAAPGQASVGPEGMVGEGSRGRTPSQNAAERSVSPVSSGSGTARPLETGGAPIPKATAVLQLPLPAPPDPRRKLLTSRNERHVAARVYAEGWRQKIEQNAPLERLKNAAQGAYENPVVTVSLKPDGTVESVLFNKSSGLPQLDEAIRQTVQSLAPFRAFSPDLSQDFDVIEIRYTWTFDAAVRLFFGGR